MPEARVDLVANQVELVWLTKYPLPNKIMVDTGKELLADFNTAMMANDYEIHCNSINVKNLRANAIVERLYKHTIGNIMHTFNIQ